jgi:hypothetical protein
MSNCKPKQLKFVGEDSFIVSKPGTKKYLMAVAQEPDVLVKQNAINAEVVPVDNITVTNPVEAPVDSQVVASAPVMITSPSWETLDCAQIQRELESIRNMLMVSRFSDPNVYQAYQDIIAKGEIVYANKCTKVELPILPPDELPPAPPVYVEPSWDSMTCEQIKQEITNIQGLLSPNTIEEQRQILVMSLKNGTKALERCNVSETPIEPIRIEPTPIDTPPPTVSGGGGGVGAPPITTITTTGTPIIATATAGGLTSGAMPKPLGGGGGGGGAKEEKPTPKKEGGINIWWIVAGAAVVYLLMSKKD